MSAITVNVAYPVLREGEDLYTTIQLGDTALFAQWAGGVYVELGIVHCGPVEVINVYDYAAGVVDLDFEKGTFQRKIEEWISEYGPEDLYRDVSENWIYY